MAYEMDNNHYVSYSFGLAGYGQEWRRTCVREPCVENSTTWYAPSVSGYVARNAVRTGKDSFVLKIRPPRTRRN